MICGSNEPADSTVFKLLLGIKLDVTLLSFVQNRLFDLLLSATCSRSPNYQTAAAAIAQPRGCHYYYK